jgi:hypothetical protein
MNQESFRTIIKPEPNPQKIGLGNSIACIGSCFAENIGNRLIENHFNCCLNPFGILFNPVSIAQSITRILSGRQYDKTELIENDGLWHSFDHHGEFSSPSADECLEQINKSFIDAIAVFNRLDCLIITLGTAFVFINNNTQKTVANCRKIPQSEFTRKLVSINDITNSLSSILEKLYQLNPNLNCIVTVSPVRHLRDNPNENAVSKAHLISAVNELQNKFQQLHYFPAYEIMMDDLRDYRFYDEDMAHPNTMAVDYIWQRFCEATMVDDAASFINEYDAIRQAKAHRVINKTSNSTIAFIKQSIDKTKELQARYPLVKLSDDLAYFNSLLSK